MKLYITRNWPDSSFTNFRHRLLAVSVLIFYKITTHCRAIDLNIKISGDVKQFFYYFINLIFFCVLKNEWPKKKIK